MRSELLVGGCIFEDNTHPWHDWLFISDYQRRGFRRFTEWGVRQRLAYLQRCAKLPRHRFNDLRHAYIVYSLVNGANVTDVRNQAGHHTSTHTINRYAQVADSERKDRHRKTSPRSGVTILTDGG